MADLTNEQLQFLETFVLRERRDLAGLDLATPHDDGAPDLQAELVTLRGLLDTLGPPEGADAAEVAEVQGMQREAFAMLDDPVTRADLVAAGRVAEAMRAPVDRIERRIRRDALRAGLDAEEARVGEGLLAEDAEAVAAAIAALRTALAGDDIAGAALDQADAALTALGTQIDDAGQRAQADREARAAEAQQIRGEVQAASVEHVAEEEGTELTALAEKVTEGWDDPPSHEQIAAAKPALEALKARADEIRAEVTSRKDAAAALLAEVRAITVDGVDTGETEEIAAAVTALAAGLPEYPSAAQLATAGEAKGRIETLAETMRAACEARLKRRDEILAAQDGATIDGIVSAERSALEEAIAAFPDLSGTPSRETMTTAEAALTALQEVIDKTTAAVAERQKFAVDVGAVLAAVAWNTGEMTPHAEAPATLMDPIRLRAEALVASNALLSDAAKADGWPDLSDGQGEAVLAKLGDERDELHADMARANDAAKRVADKHAAVRDAIAGTTIFTLSGGQQSAMTTLASEAAAKLETDPDQASLAIGALDDVDSAVRALQIDLYGYKLRIDGVDITPAGASKAEAAQLKKLQTAALAELEKALP